MWKGGMIVMSRKLILSSLLCGTLLLFYENIFFCKIEFYKFNYNIIHLLSY